MTVINVLKEAFDNVYTECQKSDFSISEAFRENIQ
jgi:hypothetical protein